MKLNQLLAKAEHTSKQFKALLDEYINTFKSKQGIFQGRKQNYVAMPDQEDQPSQRGHIMVQSTVKEYLQWFEETTEDFVNDRFAIEATNAKGVFADLVVDGLNFGMLSSLELLRLNDFLNEAELLKMYQTLPVRSDTKSWRASEDPEYAEKGIWETEAREALTKTTIKSSRILLDPNLASLKGNQNYIPQVVPDDKSVVLGTATLQEFSGEMSHRDRAEILRRLTTLKAAVKEALVRANDIATVPSQLTSKKLFGYLHRGMI